MKLQKGDLLVLTKSKWFFRYPQNNEASTFLRPQTLVYVSDYEHISKDDNWIGVMVYSLRLKKFFYTGHIKSEIDYLTALK